MMLGKKGVMETELLGEDDHSHLVESRAAARLMHRFEVSLWQEDPARSFSDAEVSWSIVQHSELDHISSGDGRFGKAG
jgi:hypothetical protein